jgi:hypothetical protein
MTPMGMMLDIEPPGCRSSVREQGLERQRHRCIGGEYVGGGGYGVYHAFGRQKAPLPEAVNRHCWKDVNPQFEVSFPYWTHHG